MSDSVQQIKERLSIVDVVSPYVKITRAGKYWKGLSPFTKEKSPSFFVSPDRGLYHCFSTGKGGDMFTFIEEMEGVDFKGALKILADKAGVELTPEKPGERGQKEKILEALDTAREFFVSEKKKRPDVDLYLKGRGLSDETITEWSIGYAPKEWQALRDHMTAKGFADTTLEEAGLIKKADSEETKADTSRLYDRFRGRIMFPIRDVSGRTIAFSGRIFEDDVDHPQAKYLNSPETSVFDKSRALYGIDKAKEGIRHLNASMLVEGQLDLLLSHQAGYRNAVATSGTACTQSHLELLKRYSENILICYDGDRAGISAAGRAASLALPMGMNVKIVKLPPGKDPADVIHEDASVFKEAVRNGLHVVDFYLAHIADAKYDARTYRLEVSRTVLPYVAMIPNKIDQAHFVKRVAESLGIGESAVLEEVKKVERNVATPSAQPRRQFDVSKAEPFLSRADSLERVMYGLSLSLREDGDVAMAEECARVLKEAVGDERYLQLETSQSDDKRAALFDADIFLESHSDEEEKAKAFNELFDDLRKESLHEHYRETLLALRMAETAHDEARADELMRYLNSLAIKLR